ncbi:MAG: hypothetical protein WCJ95_21045 [Mariniphaga sp.]
MRTLKTRFESSIQRISFRRINSIQVIGAIMIVSLYSCTAPYMVGQYREGGYTAPPSWAQNFDNENPANYYYLPDIECYYDLRNREFVYMENGSWRFSALLPSIYASFNLNNCFVVKLNNSVNEPWMHFQYYVSHYPRYYYKSINRGDHNHEARWFNENVKHSGYNNRRNEPGTRNENRQVQRSDRDQMNNGFNSRKSTDGGNRKENRHTPEVRGNEVNNRGGNPTNVKDGNHNMVKQNPDSRPNPQRANEGQVNREQPMKYYGRQIGQPVKVQKNMRKPQENKGEVKRQEKRERKSE